MFHNVPFNVYTGFDRAGFTSGNDPRPNYIGGCDPYAGSRTVAQWFNPRCYALQPVGTDGDTGRNSLKGPKFFNTDISLSKDNKLSEQVRLQFRAVGRTQIHVIGKVEPLESELDALSLLDLSTVLAIFAGVPYMVMTDGVQTRWANPFLGGEPRHVNYFSPQTKISDQ